MTEKEYYKKVKKIRMKHKIDLLTELIYLNYLYYNKNEKNINVKKIYNELNNPINYNDSEIDKIIISTKRLFKEKYNITIS